jgi:hypothetical protein
VTLASGDVIELDDLPAAVRGDYSAALGPSLQRNETLRAWGSRYARLILDRAAGNKREACRVLNISYHTLQAYLRYPIHDPVAAGDETWPVESGPDNVMVEPEPVACVSAGDA